MTARPSTPAENEAALALLAIVEACYNNDQDAANILLDPWRDNLAPVLQFAVELLALLIRQACDDPRTYIESFRVGLINAMANGGPQ